MCQFCEDERSLDELPECGSLWLLYGDPCVTSLPRLCAVVYASGKCQAATGETVSLGEKRDALEREPLRIQAEITSYPMPIPACDAYFNHLVEERSRVCGGLASVDLQLEHLRGSREHP